MIIKCDKSQLEWRSYLHWSQDPVGIQEIKDGVDVHGINQEVFKLPERVIAKIFLFRWIYWGPAYAYANDADFMPTSDKESFWQNVIDKANDKYKVLYKFQNDQVAKAQRGEIIQIPSGRQWKFEIQETKRGYEWPVRDIVNWPNQGYAADLMTIMRVSMFNRIKKTKEYQEKKVLLFNTVHDDVELDVDNNPEVCYNICILLEDVCKDVPTNFERIYKTPFNVPLAGEVSFDVNLRGTLWNEKKKKYSMRVFDRNLGKDQFRW